MSASAKIYLKPGQFNRFEGSTEEMLALTAEIESWIADGIAEVDFAVDEISDEEVEYRDFRMLH